MAYTYQPELIKEAGKDRMRFELGDTMVDCAENVALTDEEINAVLEMHPGKWKRAKLALLESICGEKIMKSSKRKLILNPCQFLPFRVE